MAPSTCRCSEADLLTGIILAGGQSRRMGQDKALLQRGSQSMLSFCHGLLSRCGICDIRLSRNTGDGIADIYPQSGPVGGIYSALRQRPCVEAIVVPIDMPLLTEALLQRLIAAGRAQQRPAYHQNCFLPLYLPVNDSVIDYLERQLTMQGNLKVKALADNFDALVLTNVDKTPMTNTNTPQQWQQIQPLIID